jgi:DNA mismatch repair ATPase MutS
MDGKEGVDAELDELHKNSRLFGKRLLNRIQKGNPHEQESPQFKISFKVFGYYLEVSMLMPSTGVDPKATTVNAELYY